MRKRTNLWLFIAVFFVKQLSAQNLITDPIQAAMDTMYSRLDTNFIPNKMLLEKAYLNSRLTYFNGILDSAADFQELLTAAEDLRFMYVGKSNPHIILRNKIQTDINNYQNASGGIIPLTVLDFTFGSIDSNAFEKNLLKVEGYYIKDIFPRSTSPYITDRTLIFSPAINNGGLQSNFSFILKREHIFKNNVNSNFESNIRVNFDDGLGFRTVQFDQPIQINYNVNNRGRRKLIIEIEVREPGGLISKRRAYSYFDLSNQVASIGTPGEIGDELCPIDNQSFWVTSDLKLKSFNYEEGNRGLVTVLYGTDPATGKKRTCVQKPVIFVEGIDFKNKSQPSEGYDNRFGKCNGLGLIDFLTRMELVDEKYYVMNFDHPFYQVRDMILDLNNKGYDFVYLDFEKGSDYMQKNVLVLIKLIQRINGLKSKSGSCEPNIVVGASMGGQVVKYALSMMEKHNLEHDSKLYIGFDSPHLGANIPIGFQLMAKFYADADRFSGLTIKAIKEESKYAIESRLSRPATKQLLSYHYESMGEHPLRTKFLDELNSLGNFPTETINFGISNGSGRMGEAAYSSLNFSPGDNLFTYEITLQNVIDKQISMYTPKTNIGKKIKNFFMNVVSSPTFLNGVGIAVSAITQSAVIAQITQVVTITSSSTKIFANKNGNKVFSFKPFFVNENATLNFTAAGAPEIDHVAGSLRNDISALAIKVNSELLTFGLSNITNTYNRKSYCFMPTPSTLAWKASPYNVAVTTRMKSYIVNMDKTSSQQYTNHNNVFYPDTNEMHVRATSANRNSFLTVIDGNISRASNNIYVLPNSIGSTFNHNQSQGNELFLTTLNNGAVYNINKSGALGGYNNFTNYYTQGPFNIYNRPCNNVTLNSGSTMDIYGYSVQNTTLNIVSGSQMILNSGSILRVFNYGNLVIKAGAKLVLNSGSSLVIMGGVVRIEEGAIIECRGGDLSVHASTGCLNIKGSLLVASSLTFAPTLNGGYILFDGTLSNYQNQISAANSKIKITSTNINSVVLRINQPEVILKSSQLIEITNGIVEFLKPQSRLLLDAPVSIKDIQLVQASNLNLSSANGLQVINKPGSGIFSNIIASNLNQALTVTNTNSLVSNFSGLKISNCNFGLIVYNGSAQINSSSFNKNTNGVVLNPVSSSSTVSSSNFESNTYALNVKGSATVQLRLQSNSFIGNDYGFFITSGTNTYFRCNRFIDNKYPVIAKQDATLDLRLGYNEFNNKNDFFTLIILEKAKDILLDKGYNFFFNNSTKSCFLNASCKALISGTITKSTFGCQVTATSNAYNFFQTGTNSQFNNLFNLSNAICGKVIFYDATPIQWPVSCGQFDLGQRFAIYPNQQEPEGQKDDCTKKNLINLLNYTPVYPLTCMETEFKDEQGISDGDLIENAFKIWPNPLSIGGELNIRVELQELDNTNVLIYDVLGKLILRTNISEGHIKIKDLNLNNNKGIYLIKVERLGEILFSRKLILD
jgi:hypothetical protein